MARRPSRGAAPLLEVPVSVIAVPCVFSLLIAAGPADGRVPDADATTADPLLRLGERVASVRTDVDALAAEVARERAGLHDEVAALERRRRELEERIALATLTARELEASATAARAIVDDTTAAQTASRAPVGDAIRRLRVVQARVPFRLHARRARLAAVEAALSTSPAPSSAAALWPIIVDEARLLQGRGRIKQAITVDATPVMAELAHVGPLVWWRAGDGRVGVASLRTTGDTPRFVVVDDAESRQRLGLFFEALRRGTPTGSWLVPSPLRRTAEEGTTP